MLTKSSSSSSSRRPESRRKVTAGCMSGLFQLFHHRSRSHKRLPSGEKKENSSNSAEKPFMNNVDAANSCEKKETTTIISSEINSINGTKTTLRNELRRHSCDVALRSPTIPPEIRRSCSVGSPAVSPRCPPAIIARLMGLEEGAPTLTPTISKPQLEPAAEKRRRLLGALEKCDEDLRSLKKIIDAVCLAETQRKLSDSAINEDVLKAQEVDVEKCSSEVSSELQPSPVSVLDAISSSPRCYSHRFDQKAKETRDPARVVRALDFQVTPNGSSRSTRSPITGDDNHSFFRRALMEDLPWFSGYNEGKLFDQYCFKIKRFSNRRRRSDDPHRLSISFMNGTRSAAMVESVVEVWEEGLWEQRWEMEKIGLSLEDDMLRELVEEFAAELMTGGDRRSCCNNYLRANCRKRLFY